MISQEEYMDPFSLFSQASSRKPGKSRSPSTSQPTAKPSPNSGKPSPVVKSDSKVSAPSPVKREEERGQTREMLNKVKDMHDQLEKSLEKVYEKLGWTSNYVKDFLDNPNNFDPKQWEQIQKQRQILRSGVWQGIGEEDERKMKSTAKQKEMDKTIKERKGKTMGARRNWISVR